MALRKEVSSFINSLSTWIVHSPRTSPRPSPGALPGLQGQKDTSGNHARAGTQELREARGQGAAGDQMQHREFCSGGDQASKRRRPLRREVRRLPVDGRAKGI